MYGTTRFPPLRAALAVLTLAASCIATSIAVLAESECLKQDWIHVVADPARSDVLEAASLVEAWYQAHVDDALLVTVGVEPLSGATVVRLVPPPEWDGRPDSLGYAVPGSCKAAVFDGGIPADYMAWLIAHEAGHAMMSWGHSNAGSGGLMAEGTLDSLTISAPIR